MPEITPDVALYGTSSPPARSRLLTAGPLSVELEEGGLRRVRWHGVEILRGIAYLVRDSGWGTLPAELSGLAVEEEAGGFRVRYEARVAASGRSYLYEVSIRGSADGRLEVEAAGRAVTDVLTCRTGFVVLHPLEGVAGRPVEILHADGRREEGRFPALISPGQPIFSIRSLAHEPVPGLRATCVFEGDVFEMEDQRNWTDASFKTYVRPLSLPTPYTLSAGTRVAQAVRLSLSGAPEVMPATAVAATATDAGDIRVTLGGPSRRALPPVGLGIDWRRLPEQEASAELARTAGVRLLVGRFDPLAADLETLRSYARLVERTGAELLLELPLSCRRDPDAELGEVAALVEAARLPLAGVTVAPAAYLKSHQPDGPWPEVPSFADLHKAARRAFPGLAIGGGLHAFFTELNRARPPVEGCDHVGVTTSPIVHAADERSLRETLDALPAVLDTARSFCGGVPLRIGPSAIGMRDNPYGQGPLENPGNGRLPMARMDPRQRGLFGAGWYLGYAAALALALARDGVASIALGALAGEFGFAYRRTEYPQPWFDDTADARVYPAYHVLRALARAGGAPLLDLDVTGSDADGMRPVALAWETGQGGELWLANLSPRPVRLTIAGAGGVQEGTEGGLRILDAASFAAACRDPLWMDQPAEIRPLQGIELPACAVARVLLPL